MGSDMDTFSLKRFSLIWGTTFIFRSKFKPVTDGAIA
jgi:hypothetical protein